MSVIAITDPPVVYSSPGRSPNSSSKPMSSSDDDSPSRRQIKLVDLAYELKEILAMARDAGDQSFPDEAQTERALLKGVLGINHPSDWSMADISSSTSKHTRSKRSKSRSDDSPAARLPLGPGTHKQNIGSPNWSSVVLKRFLAAKDTEVKKETWVPMVKIRVEQTKGKSLLITLGMVDTWPKLVTLILTSGLAHGMDESNMLIRDVRGKAINKDSWPPAVFEVKKLQQLRAYVDYSTPKVEQWRALPPPKENTSTLGGTDETQLRSAPAKTTARYQVVEVNEVCTDLVVCVPEGVRMGVTIRSTTEDLQFLPSDCLVKHEGTVPEDSDHQVSWTLMTDNDWVFAISPSMDVIIESSGNDNLSSAFHEINYGWVWEGLHTETTKSLVSLAVEVSRFSSVMQEVMIPLGYPAHKITDYINFWYDRLSTLALKYVEIDITSPSSTEMPLALHVKITESVGDVQCFAEITRLMVLLRPVDGELRPHQLVDLSMKDITVLKSQTKSILSIDQRQDSSPGPLKPVKLYEVAGMLMNNELEEVSSEEGEDSVGTYESAGSTTKTGWVCCNPNHIGDHAHTYHPQDVKKCGECGHNVCDSCTTKGGLRRKTKLVIKKSLPPARKRHPEDTGYVFETEPGVMVAVPYASTRRRRAYEASIHAALNARAEARRQEEAQRFQELARVRDDERRELMERLEEETRRQREAARREREARRESMRRREAAWVERMEYMRHNFYHNFMDSPAPFRRQ